MLPMNNKGLSLIEVLVSVTLLGMALVAGANAVVRSLQAAEYARNKTEATKLSTQVLEWIRLQKNSLSWQDFKSKSDSSGRVYCLNDSLSSLTWSGLTTGACADYDLKDRFKRQVSNTSPASCVQGGSANEDVVKIEVSVFWGEGNKKVDTITCFSKWSLE